VTPLRVERGPLEFEYFDAAADITRPASDIVLKLVLRFENVSNDQEFTPLDAHLVFNKQSDSRRRAAAKANNFVCRADEKLDVARHVFVYDLSPDSTWLIRGENLGRDLKPGESVEAFIPTSEEGLDALAGPLLWRVHFRKGYNPTSLRGVTTVIEVPFRSEDIVPSTEQETT
jgi:hypothetical protein